jgi:hypothetical protein
MENVIIKEIQGKYINYVEITALPNYCFYDIDNPNYYMTKIATPNTNIEELAKKYIVVEGDADKLNEELQNTYSETDKPIEDIEPRE